MQHLFLECFIYTVFKENRMLASGTGGFHTFTKKSLLCISPKKIDSVLELTTKTCYDVQYNLISPCILLGWISNTELNWGMGRDLFHTGTGAALLHGWTLPDHPQLDTHILCRHREHFADVSLLDWRWHLDIIARAKQNILVRKTFLFDCIVEYLGSKIARNNGHHNNMQ